MRFPASFVASVLVSVLYAQAVKIELGPLEIELNLPGLHPKPSKPPVDPCSVIAGKNWVAPSEVRACFESFKIDQKLKTNVSGSISVLQ